MKILRVTGDLYPSLIGGIAVHAHEMSKVQANLGNRVTVYTSLWENEQSEEQREGYNIVRFKGMVILRNNISLQLFFRLLRERNEYDICHAHSHLFFSTALCALMRKLGSPPLVVTNHGLISKAVPLWFHRAYMALIGKWIYRAADAAVCYTEIEKDQLVKIGVPSKKIITIHNGVDTNRFSPRVDVVRKKQILWIGRYAPEKGINYLLRGFQLFSKEFPDYALMMVGQGPLKDASIKLIEELGLQDNVIIKDFVENQELPELYNQSSVFILPSLAEGVPRTILEAMACGTPVVCTNLPQLIKIVSECGLLIPPGDPDAIARSLADLASDRKMAQAYGREGRMRAVSSYSWNDTVARTLELYSSLTKEYAGIISRKVEERSEHGET